MSQMQPALSVDMWDDLADGIQPKVIGLGSPFFEAADVILRKEPAACIAIANHRLPDSDPRKITREKIALMRMSAARPGEPGWQQGSQLRAFADALESYLPPRP